MKPWIVMRTRNEMPLIAATLAMVARQSVPCDLLVMDNASTDGSGAEARRYTSHVLTVPQGTYVPGRVLNEAMEQTQGEYVLFLNADCTPVDEHWAAQMLAGFTEHTAAVFGRQVPRPGCAPLYAKDIEDTYGDGSRQRLWRHCFSMASSAIRRSVWRGLRFSETLAYSEDIDWSWRARQHGGTIGYAADALVLHSHNYTLRQWYRRQYGEGYADAQIFDWPQWERSWLRYSLLPFGRQMASDARYAVAHGAWRSLLHSPLLRTMQMLGRQAGFRAGRALRGERA